MVQPKLRTRRSLGSTGSMSLPCFHEHDPACPSSSPIDDFSASDYDEDEAFPLKIVESYPLCRVKNRRSHDLAVRNFLVRSILVVAIVVSVCFNVNARMQRSSTIAYASERMADTTQMHTIARRLTVQSEEVQSLKNLSDETLIRRNSEKLLKEKFGPGPHLVELELSIWEGDTPTQAFFVVETSTFMPTAVFSFLRQVSSGLWDNTSFHLNAAHVIAARTVSGNGLISKREQFENSGFGSLPFPEYSDNYPHLPYTLGFVGSGPEFYINKRQNFHQDACFANVVIGRTVVDQIARMRGYDNDPDKIRPVEIVSARIVDRMSLNEQASIEYMMASRS